MLVYGDKGGLGMDIVLLNQQATSTLPTTIEMERVANEPSVDASLTSEPEYLLVNANSATSEYKGRPAYMEVRNTLAAMCAGKAGEWTIEENVHALSKQVLDALNQRAIPEPQILCHGSKSVVFSWEKDAKSLYLTVSALSIGVLISTQDKVLVRDKLPPPNIEPTGAVFSALQYSYLLTSK